jgi:hypothetical protein
MAKVSDRTLRSSARLALAMLLAAGSASAIQAQDNLLYKCVDANGKVSIQSNACPAGSTTAWRRAAPSEPQPTASQQAQAEAKVLRDQQTVRELSEVVDKKLKESTAPAKPTPPAAEISPAPSPIAIDPCQVAQAFATSVREKSWIGLTDDQNRRIYGWVAEQCKVKTAIDD